MGGFRQDEAELSWGCGRAPPGCPKVVPVEGATCAEQGLRCSYDFRACAAANPSAFVCQDRVWKFVPRPCS